MVKTMFCLLHSKELEKPVFCFPVYAKTLEVCSNEGLNCMKGFVTKKKVLLLPKHGFKVEHKLKVNKLRRFCLFNQSKRLGVQVDENTKVSRRTTIDLENFFKLLSDGCFVKTMEILLNNATLNLFQTVNQKEKSVEEAAFRSFHPHIENIVGNFFQINQNEFCVSKNSSCGSFLFSFRKRPQKNLNLLKKLLVFVQNLWSWLTRVQIFCCSLSKKKTSFWNNGKFYKLFPHLWLPTSTFIIWSIDQKCAFDRKWWALRHSVFQSKVRHIDAVLQWLLWTWEAEHQRGCEMCGKNLRMTIFSNKSIFQGRKHWKRYLDSNHRLTIKLLLIESTKLLLTASDDKLIILEHGILSLANGDYALLNLMEGYVSESSFTPVNENYPCICISDSQVSWIFGLS